MTSLSVYLGTQFFCILKNINLLPDGLRGIRWRTCLATPAAEMLAGERNCFSHALNLSCDYGRRTRIVNRGGVTHSNYHYGHLSTVRSSRFSVLAVSDTKPPRPAKMRTAAPQAEPDSTCGWLCGISRLLEPESYGT